VAEKAHGESAGQGRTGHTSTSWRRCSGYTTPSGFSGFGLKILGGRFAESGPRNLGEGLR